jgi:hypothetical protein
LSLLHAGGVPASGVRGLQGRGIAEEALHEPEQDVFAEAERELRGISAGIEQRDQASAVHGSFAVRWGIRPDLAA